MKHAASLIILTALGVAAQSVPPAIFTDPPADKAHPAAMTVIHIPTHGLLINGVVYQPLGAGLHPAASRLIPPRSSKRSTPKVDTRPPSNTSPPITASPTTASRSGARS